MAGRKAPRGRRQRPADAPERWLIYCRQSETDEDPDDPDADRASRDSLSLASQEVALREAAARAGAVVVASVRDADLKGYQDETQRPALREALQRADAGEYDVLAVWELSRLARKLSLQERIFDRLTAAGVRVHSQREDYATVAMVRQILGAVAEEYTRTNSANVSRAMRELRRQGVWASQVPYGYTLGEDRRLTPDPVAADIVRDCYRRYLSGESTAGIARGLNTGGIPSPREHHGSRHPPNRPVLGGWDYNSVRRILVNPVYRGDIVTGDEVVPDTHEAVVDRTTWERVQHRHRETARALPGSRFGRTTVVPTFLDGGRAQCACGARLGPAWTARHLTDGSLRVYHVLRCIGLTSERRQGRAAVGCDARPRTVMLHLAETFTRRTLGRDLAAARPWREVAAEIESARHAEAPDLVARRSRLTRRRRDVAGRRDRAVALHVSGRIDLDTYDALVAGIADELLAIDAEIATLDTDAPEDGLHAMSVAAREWAPLIEDAPTDTLRAAMAAVGARLVLDGAVPGRFRLEYAPEFAALLPAR